MSNFLLQKKHVFFRKLFLVKKPTKYRHNRQKMTYILVANFEVGVFVVDFGLKLKLLDRFGDFFTIRENSRINQRLS